MSIQDPRECKHYYPGLKAYEYQEVLATTYGEGIRIMVCKLDKCKYFTLKRNEMKTELTIEESARLIKLGVDAKLRAVVNMLTMERSGMVLSNRQS